MIALFFLHIIAYSIMISLFFLSSFLYIELRLVFFNIYLHMEFWLVFILEHICILNYDWTFLYFKLWMVIMNRLFFIQVTAFLHKMIYWLSPFSLTVICILNYNWSFFLSLSLHCTMIGLFFFLHTYFFCYIYLHSKISFLHLILSFTL